MNMACGADEVEHERLMPSGFYELAAHGALHLLTFPPAPG